MSHLDPWELNFETCIHCTESFVRIGSRAGELGPQEHVFIHGLLPKNVCICIAFQNSCQSSCHPNSHYLLTTVVATQRSTHKYTASPSTFRQGDPIVSDGDQCSSSYRRRSRGHAGKSVIGNYGGIRGPEQGVSYTGVRYGGGDTITVTVNTVAFAKNGAIGQFLRR